MKKFITVILTISAVLYFLILPLWAKQVNAPKDGLPVNVTISCLDSTVSIGWDSVDAVQYYIYSQDDPYGEFALIDSTTSKAWNGTFSQSKQFFYVTAEIVTFVPSRSVILQI